MDVRIVVNDSTWQRSGDLEGVGIDRLSGERCRVSLRVGGERVPGTSAAGAWKDLILPGLAFLPAYLIFADSLALLVLILSKSLYSLLGTPSSSPRAPRR